MKLSTLSILIFLITLKSFSQTNLSNSRNNLKDSIYESYSSSLANDIKIFNGRVYSGYSFPITGSVFFLDSISLMGEMFYDSVKYKNIKFSYDLVKDQLLAEVKSKVQKVILPKDLISHFYLETHYFINLQLPDQDNKNGFYEVLNDYGNSSLISKRKKKIEEDLSGSYVIRYIKVINSYFYLNEGKLTEINSWKTLYKLFPNKKRGIRRLKNSENLNFKKDTENAIKQAVDFAKSN